jgi:tRNA nucleotidyltransferase (CCA-adding enzyme)
MNEYKLLPFLHSNIVYGPQMERLLEEIRSVLAWYDLSFIRNGCQRWLVYLLALADALNSTEMPEFCSRMEFPPRLSNWLIEGREKAASVGRRFYRKTTPKPSEIYHLLEVLDSEWLLFIMAKTQQEETRRCISLYFRNLKEVHPELRGRDLKEMGIKPGPIYREILDCLLDGRLNGELLSREQEVEFVQKHFMQTTGELRV